MRFSGASGEVTGDSNSNTANEPSADAVRPSFGTSRRKRRATLMELDFPDEYSQDTVTFVKAMRTYIKEQYAVFSKFDHDKNLRLDKDEYAALYKEKFFTLTAMPITDQAIAAEFDRIDVDGDLSITFKEFIEYRHLNKWKAILKGGLYEELMQKYHRLQAGYPDVYKGLRVFAKVPSDEAPEIGAKANKMHHEYVQLRDTPAAAQKEAKAAVFNKFKSEFERHAWAQAVLGEMYEKGFGVQKSDAESQRFYQQAAANGVAWAIAKLGSPSLAKKAGDPQRQKALGAMYPARVAHVRPDGMLEVEFETIDGHALNTFVMPRAHLEPRVATESLRWISTGFDEWWNGLSVLGFDCNSTDDDFDYHELNFGAIVGAADAAEAAAHAAALATESGNLANISKTVEAERERNDKAADAAFWRYALQTRRVNQFYRRAFMCTQPKEIRRGDAVEYRSGGSSWLKGTVLEVPFTESKAQSSASSLGHSFSRLSFSRSSRTSFKASKSPFGSSSGSFSSSQSMSMSSSFRSERRPGTSMDKYKVKHRYKSTNFRTYKVGVKDLRPDIGFIVKKVQRSNAPMDSDDSVLRRGIGWLRGIACCAHVGQSRVVTVQTGSTGGISARGQDKQPSIILYRPDADPNKQQKVAKRIPVSHVTSIDLGNTRRNDRMPDSDAFKTFGALNSSIPADYCFSIRTDVAEKGARKFPASISITTRGVSGAFPVTGTYYKKPSSIDYVRAHAGAGDDCHIVVSLGQSTCFSPRMQRWQVIVGDVGAAEAVHRTKSGARTPFGSTWETRQSSCIPGNARWTSNEDLLVREGHLTLPHALLLSKGPKGRQKQEKWFLELQNEDASRWGGAYVKEANEDDSFVWEDLPTFDEGGEGTVDWKQVLKTSGIHPPASAREQEAADNGLDWTGMYVLDPRPDSFRFGYPRFVRAEPAWKGDICKEDATTRMVSKPRYVLARERDGRWCLRCTSDIVHVCIKDVRVADMESVSYEVVVRPEGVASGGGASGNNYRGSPLKMPLKCDPKGLFLNDGDNEVLANVSKVQLAVIPCEGGAPIYDDMIELTPPSADGVDAGLEDSGWRRSIWCNIPQRGDKTSGSRKEKILLQVSVSPIILYSRTGHEPSEDGARKPSSLFYDAHSNGMSWTYHILFENKNCRDQACSGMQHAHDVVVRPLPQKVEITDKQKLDAPTKVYKFMDDIFTTDATCFVQNGLPVYRSRYDTDEHGGSAKLFCRFRRAPSSRTRGDPLLRAVPSFALSATVIEELPSRAPLLPSEWRVSKHAMLETLDLFVPPCGSCADCRGGRSHFSRTGDRGGGVCKHAKSERDDLAAALSRFILGMQIGDGDTEVEPGVSTFRSGVKGESPDYYQHSTKRFSSSQSISEGHSSRSLRHSRSCGQGDMKAEAIDVAAAAVTKDGSHWLAHENRFGDGFD